MIDLRPTIVPKSDHFNADDLIGITKTIKITKVALCADPAQPIAIHFEGDCGKPYKPGKSMRRVLINAWGDDGATFPGRRMTLFRDEKVQFGGFAVGGIRISHMSHIGDHDLIMALTMSKASRKPYTVKPLPNEDGSPSRTTLADRVVAFKDAVLAAPTVDERKALRKRASKLFQDIDADQSADFVTTAAGLDKWFGEQVGVASENEKAPLARQDRIQADPEGPQPPKARDEINGPAPSGVTYMLAGDPVSDAGRVPTYKDGEKHSTVGGKGAADLARYTMHPTPKAADDGAIPTEDDEDAFPGDKPAPGASDDTMAFNHDADDDEVWNPLESTEGPAPRGVEYTLRGDEITDDGAQAYEDGEATRLVGYRDFAALPEYDEHPVPLEEVEADVVDEKTATIFDEMAQDTSWLTLKARLPKISNDPEFQALPDHEQDSIYRQIWAVVVALKEKHRDPVDPADDPTAFRIWATTQVGPEGADAVDGTLRTLKTSARFLRMAEKDQAKLVSIAEGIATQLRG